MSTAPPPPTIPISTVPQNLRQVAHFLKIANEYANRDIVIYYWCLFKAIDDAMHIDSTSPEAKQFLIPIVDILEQLKKAYKDNDAILQNVVAQSHIEDQAQRLFQYAESQDSQGQFNQKMMKAFYTCGYLFDVLTMFGNLDENIQSARKYAKWRATYIFGCLKRGEQPTPGNKPQDGHPDSIAAEINDDLSAELNALNASMNGPATKSPPPSNSYQNEFGFQQPQHQQVYQPPTGPSPYGAYPSIGQFPAGQPPNAFGPKPGLQGPFTGPGPFAGPGPFNPHQQPAAKPRATGQPGGGVPRPATEQAMPPVPTISPQTAAQNLKLEDYLEAKKYTKFAASALDYEDPKTAIDYLQKAILVLQKLPIP